MKPRSARTLRKSDLYVLIDVRLDWWNGRGARRLAVAARLV